MTTYEDNLLAVRFAALAPEPLPGDWDDVLGRAGAARNEQRRPGVAGALQRRRRVVALAFALLIVAAVGALFVDAPWRSSPGFLERAQAALAPPADAVLHVRWSETWRGRAKVLGCTVEVPTQEMWIDQTPPHRYRMLVQSGPPPANPQGRDPGTNACRFGLRGEIAEFGGALDTGLTPLVLVPPDTLRTATGTYYNFPPDPVAALRKAIADGSAHDEGTSEIDGRTVRRILIDPGCTPSPCDELWTTYVDPVTFALVREEMPNSVGITPGPGSEHFRFDMVIDYLAFEYLPRTAANFALTDIRAQHPNATGP